MSLIPSTTYFEDAPSVACGNKANHRSGDVEWHQGGAVAVKACYGLVGLCTWQNGVGHDEDGERTIVECYGIVIPNDRGWTCTNGHEHVTAEARMREGWDYASDEGEAALLRSYGVDAVAMNGGSI